MNAVTVDRGRPMLRTEVDAPICGTIVQCIVASVGPYIAKRMPAVLLEPPNSRTTRVVNISPIVSKHLSSRSAALLPRSVVTTVGVNSTASIFRRRIVPGKSANMRSFSQQIKATPRSQGKKTSNTETSKVGAANWRKRLKLGICSSWASNDCVTA